MVKVVALAPERAALFKVALPCLAHCDRVGCGGGLLFCMGGQGFALQLAWVFAFINQALQFAGLGLSVWDAPGVRAANGQADVG